MDYLAHLEGKREQTIKMHAEGTACLSRMFADSFGKKDWGYCCGMLHDIGKYSEAFQKRIRGNNNKQVDHSSAGAQLCWEKGGMYPIISYCIAGHHAGLPDYGSSTESSTLMGRKGKKVEDYQAYQEEINIPELKSQPFDPDKAANFDFSLSVFIRMIYSCLVDADFLDTERFMTEGQTVRDSGESMEVLLDKLESYIAGWLQNKNWNTINGRRTEILKNCLAQGRSKKGLFRLTVPTGGGKTIASLAFALSHGVTNHMDRVIYVIPYTSVIEQNAAVFRSILGEQNVLENHCNVDYDSEDGKRAEELRKMQLASENWDKPLVVTTNVQFFESLFSNKPSKCRKLHNIANSVIIFDEAQMLPNDYLKPSIAMMEELIDHYESSIVLCTATQPALGSFFTGGRKATELCPRMDEQFRFFERTRFQNLGTVTEEDLIEKLALERQALCIVNTRRKAQMLYKKLRGESVFHLSTTMYPKHRRRILEEVRHRLKQGERCILISTSLVEAGVDLDFETVYRQLAGADSIIQAAGRCNREGKRKAEESNVLIFQFVEKEVVPGQRQQIDVTKGLLAEGMDISSLDGIEEYFKRLYHCRGESLDKKKIMEEFKSEMKYNFAKVGGEFNLIEEDTKIILIHCEEEASAILQRIKYQGYTKSEMRKASQYCVQVDSKELGKLRGAGAVKAVSEDMEDFFELVDESMYTETMGLNLEIDSGIAMFS